MLSNGLLGTKAKKPKNTLELETESTLGRCINAFGPLFTLRYLRVRQDVGLGGCLI